MLKSKIISTIKYCHQLKTIYRLNCIILQRIENTELMGEIQIRKPAWLKTKIPIGKDYLGVKEIVEKNKLHTICTSGHCPNIADCWGRGTATLMILGDICTRACRFCNVKTGRPLPVDLQEPERVAKSVKLMGIKHCVLTSVDRDDLEDGGAGIWAQTILRIKEISPKTTIETLIPDFDGKEELIQIVIGTRPEIISHNLETVKRITPIVRSKAKYETSLKVIRLIADSPVRSKSGIMLGLGETEEEVYECMDDLRTAGCEVLTIGQYLQPTRKHLSVMEFVKPEIFEKYRLAGLERGFLFVESSPLVRSSYHAEKHV
jgi:lipoic acid synthetase